MEKQKNGIYEGIISLKWNQESYVLATNQYSAKLLITYAKFGGYIHCFREQAHSFYQTLKEVHGTKKNKKHWHSQKQNQNRRISEKPLKKKKGYFESLILKINGKFQDACGCISGAHNILYKVGYPENKNTPIHIFDQER